jgi:hypothetical protein
METAMINEVRDIFARRNWQPLLILMFPPFIVRSGVLRQGFDKFYSVSFQARLKLFISPFNPRSPET